jgi:hypothetical protein
MKLVTRPGDVATGAQVKALLEERQLSRSRCIVPLPAFYLLLEQPGDEGRQRQPTVHRKVSRFTH